MAWKKILIWALAIAVVAYLALVVYRIPAVAEKKRTEEAVARIHAQKLTLDTVMGKNLPPAPDPVANDATVEGIDANNNGIRDDVELAIHRRYPDSPQVRAVELQHALSLQKELTEVFNTPTLIAAIQEEERAGLCINEITPKISLDDDPEYVKKVLAMSDAIEKEVEDWVINSELRKRRYKEIFKYMASYGDLSGQNCDINLGELPN